MVRGYLRLLPHGFPAYAQQFVPVPPDRVQYPSPRMEGKRWSVGERVQRHVIGEQSACPDCWGTSLSETVLGATTPERYCFAVGAHCDDCDACWLHGTNMPAGGWTLGELDAAWMERCLDVTFDEFVAQHQDAEPQSSFWVYVGRLGR